MRGRAAIVAATFLAPALVAPGAAAQDVVLSLIHI